MDFEIIIRRDKPYIVLWCCKQEFKKKKNYISCSFQMLQKLSTVLALTSFITICQNKLRPWISSIFASYLANRKQIVFLRDNLSHSCNIKSGGPQGSISAVFLFSFYTNDMPEIIDNLSFLYADNTKIIRNWFDLSSI